MPKKIVKIRDLAPIPHPIDISADEQIEIRALNLVEMVQLFLESKDTFLALYAAALSEDTNQAVDQLAPFLMSSPDLVAKIIAFASDEPNEFERVKKHMPATVQLIALREIWQVSVPDPKKAQELLSEVTALLQKLSDEVKVNREIEKPFSLTT